MDPNRPTDEEALAGQNKDERIQVIRIGAGKPLKLNNSVTANWLRENLQIWLWLIVTSDLTTDNKNRAVSEHSSSRVPAAALSSQLVRMPAKN